MTLHNIFMNLDMKKKVMEKVEKCNPREKLATDVDECLGFFCFAVIFLFKF